MVDIVGIGAGDAREHVLETFARHQVAVGERGLAERREEVVAAPVELQIRGLGRAGERGGERRVALGLHRQAGDIGRQRHDMAAAVEIVGKLHGHPDPFFLVGPETEGTTCDGPGGPKAIPYASDPPGHPARGRDCGSRQVSWLAGCGGCLAFPAPKAPVA